MNEQTKPPSRRAQELAEAMLAGYDDDRPSFDRSLLERRAASHAGMLAAWESGRNARRLAETGERP